MIFRYCTIAVLLALFTALPAAAQNVGRPNIDPAFQQQLQNSYIVRFSAAVRPEQASERAAQIAAASGGRVTHVYRNAFSGFAITLPSPTGQQLRVFGGISSVTQDRLMYAFHHNPNHTKGGSGSTDPSDGGSVTPPSGPTYAFTAPSTGCASPSTAELNNAWGVRDILQGASVCPSTPVHLFVVDGGVDGSHADLDDHVVAHVDCTNGCAEGSAAASDHGTHVAGTAGARSGNSRGVVGVDARSYIWDIKVLNNGRGSFSDVIAGIDYITGVLQNNDSVSRAVVNMSLGGGGSDPGSNCNTTSDDLYNAICAATAAGAVVVVAAGNDAKDANAYIPATYDSVITVASSTSAGTLSSFSNYGSDVDVTAPGSSICSTYYKSGKGGGPFSTAPSCAGSSDYALMSGTSMASPHVAGAVALCLAKNPSLGFSAIRDKVEQNATLPLSTSRNVPGVLNVGDLVGSC